MFPSLPVKIVVVDIAYHTYIIIVAFVENTFVYTMLTTYLLT